MTTTTDRPVLAFNGIAIRDRGEMLSLTDMWRAAGSDPSKKPAKWKDQDQTREFCSCLKGTVLPEDCETFQALNEGGEWNTWAHWQIGLAYAKYLSPKFHLWCNTVVRAHMEGRLVEAPSIVPSLAEMVESAVERQLRTTLSTVVGMLVEERLAADQMASIARGFKPALQILIDNKVPPRKRRAFSQQVSGRLRRFCADRGFQVRISRESGRYLFPDSAVSEWLVSEGSALIRDHINRLNGQGTLRLVKPKKPD